MGIVTITAECGLGSLKVILRCVGAGSDGSSEELGLGGEGGNTARCEVVSRCSEGFPAFCVPIVTGAEGGDGFFAL